MIRLDPELQADYYGAEYLVQKDIWSSLDKNSQAGIVLHESLYKNAVVNLAQENSRKSRRLNRVLSEKAVDSMNFVEFANTLGSAGFSKIETEQFEITFVNSDASITPFPGGYFTAQGSIKVNTRGWMLVFDASGNLAPVSVLNATLKARVMKFLASRLIDRETMVTVKIGDHTCTPVDSCIGRSPVIECTIVLSPEEVGTFNSTTRRSSSAMANFVIGEYFGGNNPVIVENVIEQDSKVSAITPNSPLVISGQTR